MSSPKLEIMLLRHGKTRYVDPFPDLTPDGLDQVRDVARRHVTPWMTTHDIAVSDLDIISSPAPRAHGTAWAVAREIGYELPQRIAIEDKLRPMDWRDPVRAVESLKQFRGRSYVDYETEPVFQNREVFEIPGEVKYRFYLYLGELMRKRFGAVNTKRTTQHIRCRGKLRTLCVRYVHTALSQHLILVAHYEQFSNITHDLFGIVANERDALKHAEPIVLTVTPAPGGYKGEVCLQAMFRRDQSRAILFNTYNGSILPI